MKNAGDQVNTSASGNNVDVHGLKAARRAPRFGKR